MSYSWSSVAAQLPNGKTITPNTLVLLTDGTILIIDILTANWYRYLPNPTTGLYLTGSWSSNVYTMSVGRTYFASGILPDGRLYVWGAEYTNGVATFNNTGEIIDFSDPNPTWQPIRTPSSGAFNFVTGDVNSCVLADGRVLFGGASSGSTQTAIWDPNAFQGSATEDTQAWTLAGLQFNTLTATTKVGVCDEETWTLLPDNSVLTVNISAQTSERYIPVTDEWIFAGAPVKPMGFSAEMGPAMVLPNGTLFAIGASGNTGIWTPETADPWTAGPSTGPVTVTTPPNTINAGNGNIQTVTDGPCSLLPNGKVLLAAGDPQSGQTNFSFNAQVYLYDPTTNTMSVLPASEQPFPPPSGYFTYGWDMLVLPSGELVLSAVPPKLSGQLNRLQFLTVASPENAPNDEWRPTITDVPPVMLAGHTYTITGTQFNGLSQANSYGDDLQNATNYPIVRLTGNNVYFCRSFDFSTMGIATLSTPQTASITLPSMPPGDYELQVIANGIASASTVVSVAAQDCYFQLEADIITQGQVNALLTGGAPAVVTPALQIVVEGFTPKMLGFKSVADLGDASTPPAKSPTVSCNLSGLTFPCYGPVLAEDNSLPNIPQRFVYQYQANFSDQASADAIFNAISVSEGVPLTATFTASGIMVTAAAVLTLAKSPSPYMLHGDASNNAAWWLSQDLRAFTILEGSSDYFSVQMGSTSATVTASDVATQYIQQVLTLLNNQALPGLQLFEELNDTGDDQVSLSATQNGVPMYNFCIARVRYQDLSSAQNVRVFFRMWPGAQVAVYNKDSLFRTYPAGDGLSNGYKVPLLGTTTVGGDEIATIPFFATPRVSPTVSMKSQPVDSPNLVPVMTPNSNPLVPKYYYFGAWLDINQPDTKLFPSVLLGPPTASLPDGPYTGINLVSIFDLVRSAHQCLIAEISVDGDPIVAGATPGSTDLLAQRNLQFINVPNPGTDPLSRSVSAPFEIRPSPPLKNPDEMLLQWNSSLLPPSGTQAQIYLPLVSAPDVIKLANQMYFTHHLTAIDAHTILAPVDGGVTFIPIPPSATNDGATFVGLLSLDLPLGIRKGQEYGVVVKQITSGFLRVDDRVQEDAIVQVKGKNVASQDKRVTFDDVRDGLQNTLSVVTTAGQVIHHSTLLEMTNLNSIDHWDNLASHPWHLCHSSPCRHQGGSVGTRRAPAINVTRHRSHRPTRHALVSRVPTIPRRYIWTRPRHGRESKQYPT
jgi:hypothetical protein